MTVLRRRMTIVVIAVVALPAGALGYSLTAQKQYTTTAKLLFRDPGFAQQLFGSPILAPSVDPTREAATNVSLVSLDTIAEQAAASIKTRRLTPAEISSRVSVAAQGASNVVAVSATDPDPVLAAELANTIAAQYIVFRRDADRAKIAQSVQLVSRQLGALAPQQRAGDEGRSLRQQVDRLRALAALQTGNAEIVQRAELPRTPSSPKPVRNTILALILGLAIGVGLALLLDRLDRRLRDQDDAEALFARPVLGTIPESTSLRSQGADALVLGGHEAEAFRTLRANLRYYDVDRDIRSLLITSSAPGDGKSTVARYLAATAAAANVRAILVEADLRRPALKLLYPTLSGPGLSDVLSDQATLSTAIRRLPVSISGAPTGKTLDIITAGQPPPNPTDLLESERMRTVLSDLGRQYELVIVDSSPVTVVPDSIPLLAQVSGVLVVVRVSTSTHVGARRLRDQLDHLGVAALGLVMNGTSAAEESAYYGYYTYAPAAANGAGWEIGERPRRWTRPRRRPATSPKEPAAPGA
jgi:capsular exopolysaccharide synthesis family protein